MRRVWHAAGNQLCRAAAVRAGVALGLIFFALVAGCHGGSRNPALNDASPTGVALDHASMVPRVPSHDPKVSLYGLVRNLAFGSTVTVVANHVSLPPVGRNGIVRLVNDVPIGTLYDVSVPTNPRGQVCTVTPLHGAVGPHTAYVDISCRLSVVTANDVNDTVVIGQPDDGTVLTQTPPDQATMLMPWGKVFANVDSTLYVADRGNHRVLGYYPAPLSADWATMVLGQNNDFSGDGPSAGTIGFNGPSSVGGGNDLLLVADTNNNRVLIYTPPPYGQVDPTLVMGQSNLVTTSAGCGPAQLTAPNQAATSQNMVLVADSGNHRVLIWDRWPTMLGAAADVALGQPDLASCLPNQGAGLPLASSLSAPQDVWSDQNRIAVADTGNRRVLIWLTLPVLSGQAADLAVGQADLLSGASQTTSATSLNGPVSVVFDNNTLFVADSVDHRVLAYNPFPTSSGAAASYALGQHLSTDNLCNQGNLVAPFTLCMPTGVSIVEGDLAVTDSNNNRVLVFYSDPNAVGFGSFGVVVSPGGIFLASLAATADATAGEAASASVTALTFSGQVNPNYTGTITFTSTDPNAILPPNYTYTSADAGVHDFNVTFFRAATHTLAVHDILNGGSGGADPNVVAVAGNANLLAVINFPSDPNAGQQASLLVTAYDAWHNVATTFAGTVTFTSSDPNAILPAPYTYVPLDAGVHTFVATLVTPGNQSISVNANGLVVQSGTQQNIIVAAPFRALGGAVSGLVTGNVTLKNTVNGDIVRVGNGNYVFDQNVQYAQNCNVTAISPNGQLCTVANGNGVMGLNGEYNVWVTCTTQAYTLGGVVAGLVTGTQVGLQNSPDTITTSNGNFIFPTGVAYDSNFNVSLTNPNGQTCVFASNSNAGVMPASNDTNVRVTCTPNPYSLGGAISGLLANTNVILSDGNDIISRANGAYTFPTLLPYARAYTIAITNPNGQTCTFNPNTVGNGNMPYTAVTNANVACTTNAYPLGGRVSGLVTGNVTLTNTVNADVISVGNGNYLFDQNIVYAGNYYVVATSPNGQACTVQNGNATMPVGGNFNVNITCAGTPATYLVLSGYTTPRTAGQNSNVNITAYDASHNVAISYTGTVHLTTTDQNAVFSPNFTFVSAYAGSANVPIAMTTSGNRTITGNDTVTASIAGNQNTIVVNPNIANHLGLTNYTTPRAAGTNSNVTVTVYDFYNNIVPTYTGTVHFTVTDTNAIFSPNFTFVTGNAGSANVRIAMTRTGTWSITGNDTVTSSLAGIDTNIVVTPGNANRYTMTGISNPIYGCQQNNVTVTVYDAYANLDTTYTGTIALSSTDPNAVLSPNYTFVASDLGSKSLPVSLHSIGTWNVSGNDTVTPIVSGSQNGILVKHSSAVYYGLTGYPNPSTAGQQANVTISAYDVCGNLDTNYVGTVHLSSTDSNAVLSGNYTFTAANAGVATRSVLFKTAGNEVINANDTATPSISGSQNVLVNPNTALYYTATGFPLQVNIAAQQNILVSVYDYYNNVATNYTGTVHVRSTDVNATLPADHVFTAADAGQVALPVRLNSWGTWAISANDTVTATLAARESNILVAFTPINPTPVGTAGLSGYVWHRGATTTGTDPPQLADLMAQYAYGVSTQPNDLFVDSYINTTRHFQFSGTLYSQTNTYLGSDANGTAAADSTLMNSTSFLFSGYLVVPTGGNYTIASTNADDGAIAYIGGALQGGNSTLVMLRNWNGSITNAPGYSNPATIYLNQAGAYPFSLFHFDQGGGAGLDFNIYGPATVTFLTAPAPWLGSATHFSISMNPNPVVAGHSATLTVLALDANNNVATNYVGALSLSTTDTTATLTSPYTYTPLNAGVASTSIVFRSAGTWSITGNDSAFPSVAGILTNVVPINDGNATRFILNYNNIVAGTQGNVLITALNANGTVCTSYRGTVSIVTNDTNATVPANYTFGSGDNGVASVPITFKQITMNANLTVTDTNNSVLTATKSNILVYPAPNATTPSGSVGLSGRVLHRLTDQSMTGIAVSNFHTAANYLYTHTPSYTFTNSNFNNALAISYNGNDSTPFNTFLGSDAAGTAATDSNAVQTTYLDYAGYLKVSTGGNYTFTLGSVDDGALFFMGGGTAPGVSTLLLAGNFQNNTLLTNFSNPLVLYLPSAGYYPIELFWVNQWVGGGDGAVLYFNISGPGSIAVLTGSTIGFFETSPSLAELDAASQGTDATLNRMAPAITIGEPQMLPLNEERGASAACSWFSVFPHLPSVEEHSNLTFLSNRSAYRTVAKTKNLLGAELTGTPVLVSETQDGAEAGGVWLLNAMRKSDGTLVGLYRRADRSPVASPNEAVPRFTSAIAWSHDDGRTWVKQGAAVGRAFASQTSDTEPEMGCMLYDAIRQRWLGIGHGLGYLSHDPNAAPGTWFGWHEGHFDQPEPDTTGSNLVEPLPGLSEDMDECKLHFNDYLNLFVLLYRPWDGHAIMQTYSPDGVRWAKPTVLLRSTDEHKLSHAQIIGTSDVLHGRQARLIYQRRGAEPDACATLMQRPIRFQASTAGEP